MGYGGREKTCENSWVLAFCAVSGWGWDNALAGNGNVAPPMNWYFFCPCWAPFFWLWKHRGEQLKKVRILGME